MKKIIGMLAVFAFSSTAFATTNIVGDKILFQKNNTYVSAVTSDSLCFDGDSFRATFTVCEKFVTTGSQDGKCLKSATVNGVQPAVSTRQVPVFSGPNDDTVDSYRTVKFVQSPNLNVKEYFVPTSGSSKLVKSYSVTVPSCR